METESSAMRGFGLHEINPTACLPLAGRSWIAAFGLDRFSRSVPEPSRSRTAEEALRAWKEPEVELSPASQRLAGCLL